MKDQRVYNSGISPHCSKHLHTLCRMKATLCVLLFALGYAACTLPPHLANSKPTPMGTNFDDYVQKRCGTLDDCRENHPDTIRDCYRNLQICEDKGAGCWRFIKECDRGATWVAKHFCKPSPKFRERCPVACKFCSEQKNRSG